MKVLITGGAGYIGQLLTIRLLDNNHQVIILDRNQPIHKSKWIPKDLRDAKVPQCDVVVHLAWVGSPASKLTKEEQENQNMYPTIKFFSRASKTAAPHVIFTTSSGALYDSSSMVPYLEASPLLPTSTYGKAKLEVEKWFESQYLGSSTIIRFTNIVSSRQKFKAGQGIIAGIKKAALNQAPFHRRGNASKDYIHAADAISALHQCILKKPQGIFNCGSGTTMTTKEICDLAQNIYPNLKIISHQLQDHDNPSVSVSIEKIKSSLKWCPKYTAKEAVEDALKS